MSAEQAVGATMDSSAASAAASLSFDPRAISRGSGRRSAAPRTLYFFILILSCVFGLLLVGSVSAATERERSDARALLEKFSGSGVRGADGCPVNCGVNGGCKCLPGWRGASCTTPDGDVPIPERGCDPRCETGVFWKTGICQDGACVCAAGWSGTFCGINPKFPLAAGLEAKKPVTKTIAAKNNGGETTETQTTVTTVTETQATVTATDGCPDLPVATSLPLRCGPEQGYQRCPDGMCCSEFGYCGGRLRSYVAGSSKRRLARRDSGIWETAEGHEPVLVEREEDGFDGRKFYDLEVPASSLSKRQVNIEPDDPTPATEIARTWCYGARSLDTLESVYIFERSDWEKRNCARMSLRKRTNVCARTNSCCSSGVCARMTFAERTNGCYRRRRTNGGSGCCTPLPPCPPTPADHYCGEKCQPNYGKCWSKTPTCSITATAVTAGTGIPAASTETTGTGSTTSTTSATPMPTSSGSILDTMANSTLTGYSLTKILSAVQKNALVKGILENVNSNVTFVAVIDEGAGDLSRRVQARQDEPVATQYPDDVLRYLVVRRYVDTTPPLKPRKMLYPTLLNSNSTLAKVNPQYMVIRQAGSAIELFNGVSFTAVVKAVSCVNGLLFITKTLVIPPRSPVYTMKQQPETTSFAASIGTANLAETINAYGEKAYRGATIFAPINAAWDAGIQLTGTLTEAQLALAVNAHVVIEGGPYSSFELGNQSSYTLTTVQGQELNIRSDGSKIFVNDVQCLSLDILTSNGIVHIIEAELIPDDVYNSRGVTRPPRSPASTRLLQTFARTNQRASKVIAAAGTGGGIYDAGPVKPPSG